MTKHFIGWFTAFAALIVFSGCESSSPTESFTPTDTGEQQQPFVVDRLKREVSTVTPALRIVSLSPATTELLFALDLGECIVGATKHCNYPPQALQVPRVGGGTLESLSAEKIVSLKPDLVLCKWDTHQPLLATLERLNIRACAVGAQNLEELYEEATWIGTLTNRRHQAAELIAKMRSQNAALAKIVAAAKRDPPLRVFYEVWDEPLMTAAPNSFIGQLLSLAGLENILSDTSVRYPRISPEIVVQGNPDLILAPTSHFESVDTESFKLRPGWASVSAVANERIYLISGDQVSRCGPRLLDALAEIIQAAYPEVSEEMISKRAKPGVSP